MIYTLPAIACGRYIIKMVSSSLKEFLSSKITTKNYLCNIVHFNAQSLSDSSHFDEFYF